MRQVYDFVFDKSRGKWIQWLDTMESGVRALDPEAEYTSIIVPTGGWSSL